MVRESVDTPVDSSLNILYSCSVFIILKKKPHYGCIMRQYIQNSFIPLQSRRTSYPDHGTPESDIIATTFLIKESSCRRIKPVCSVSPRTTLVPPCIIINKCKVFIFFLDIHSARTSLIVFGYPFSSSYN